MKWNLIKSDIKYLFLNNFIGKIPVWSVRKAYYKHCGMKIGRGTHILLGTRIMAPDKIEIGSNSIINEECVLDGRGGLFIGDNVSISLKSMILTGTHDKNSNEYQYITKPVHIHDNAWVCTGAIVLPGADIGTYAIVGAGAVFNGVAEEKGIYAGVPAKKIGLRDISVKYEIDWNPPMR